MFGIFKKFFYELEKKKEIALAEKERNVEKVCVWNFTQNDFTLQNRGYVLLTDDVAENGRTPFAIEG